MIVTNIQFQEYQAGFELSAELVFESVPDFRRKVFFRSESGCPPPDYSGDPFFAGFLIPAMAVGEDLRIEAPVSSRLVEAAMQKVQPFMLRRNPGFRAPAIETGGDYNPPPKPESGVLCNFSGGVDSWETFLRHRAEITHVMHCQGFDRVESYTDPRYIRRMQQAARSAAERYGKTYVGMTSNLTAVGCLAMNRVLYKRGLPVDYLFQRHAYFGSQLVALAHVHASRIRKYYIASSQTYDRHLEYGSNPITDPGWSTPRLRVLHDGAGLDRTEKLESIARIDPGALDGLYVCHSDTAVGENCNDCEKCVRTRVALHLAGSLERCSTLRAPLTLDEVRMMDIGSGLSLWENLLDSAQRRGNRELTRAIEVAMRRRFGFRRTARDLPLWILRLSKEEGRRKVRRRLRHGFLRQRARILSSL
jgi:hypothetical protein